MNPSWNTITVEQYQQIVSITQSKDTEEEKVINVMSCLLDLTIRQIEDLTLQEFNKKAKEIAFVFSKEIPGKPEKYIKANGKIYFINYRIEKQRFAQYVEQLRFSQEPMPNLHLLFASMVQPVKKVLFFKRVGKNDSNRHEEVSNDILKARFIDVYHTAVFFYRVFRGSIKLMKDYLKSELMEKGLKEKEADLLIMSSINAMDGFITPKWLPTLKISA